MLQASSIEEDDSTFLLVEYFVQQNLQIKSIRCLIDFLGPFQDLNAAFLYFFFLQSLRFSFLLSRHYIGKYLNLDLGSQVGMFLELILNILPFIKISNFLKGWY